MIKIFSIFALFNQIFASDSYIPTNHVMVGGQRDENDCLTSAGYSWCEETQNCIRQWVTPCTDNYDDCNDCLKRQRKGENIACPVNCENTRDTSDCSQDGYIWCPVMNRCTDPNKEPCFRIMEPGPVIDPLSNSPPTPCPEVMCMMYCVNGRKQDENGCDICSCNNNSPVRLLGSGDTLESIPRCSLLHSFITAICN